MPYLFVITANSSSRVDSICSGFALINEFAFLVAGGDDDLAGFGQGLGGGDDAGLGLVDILQADRAHMWFSFAALQGHEMAKKMRELTSAFLTPSQLETAQRLARECVQKNYKGC